MKKNLLILVFTFILFNISFAQKSELEFVDDFLTTGFKTFNSVDLELGYCIGEIMEERLVSELKESKSFKNPFSKLSEYVSIINSKDSLLRTFSWDKRDGGSMHDMASYAQYKTATGKIKLKKLDLRDEGDNREPTEVAIYKIHTLKLMTGTYYLLIGWGTYGGGKHHSLARVYKIEDDSLILCTFFFKDKKHLFAEANRVDKIDLEFNSNTKTLSYYHYKEDEETGFYYRNGKKEFLRFLNLSIALNGKIKIWNPLLL